MSLSMSLSVTKKKSFNGLESNRSIDHFQEGKLSFDDDPLPGRRSLMRQAIYLAQLANSLANAGVLLLRSDAAKCPIVINLNKPNKVN